jgi:hypothetical protein
LLSIFLNTPEKLGFKMKKMKNHKYNGKIKERMADIDYKKISREIHQLKITLTLTNVFKCRTPQERYEYLNCIERWLIAMVNYSSEPSSFAIYKKLKPEFPFNALLARELVKALRLQYNVANAIVEKFIKIVNKYVEVEPTLYKEEIIYDEKTKFLYYGDIISMPLAGFRNIQQILKIGTKQDAMLIMLRYCAFITGGQHWAVPLDHYTYLYEKIGVRNEGFASILNTKAVYHQGSSFCSIFPDIEGKFGSLGSFFKVDLGKEGAWAINPPYLESVIDDTIDKVLKHLQNADDKKEKFTAYLILPAWDDMKSIQTLQSSKYTIKSIKLTNDMFFELLDGTPYFIKTPQRYTVVSTSNSDALIDGLLNIKKVTPSKPPHNYSSKHMIEQIEILV